MGNCNQEGNIKTGVFSYFSLAEYKEINIMARCTHTNVNLVIFPILHVTDEFMLLHLQIYVIVCMYQAITDVISQN